jgi:hypothetical protein
MSTFEIGQQNGSARRMAWIYGLGRFERLEFCMIMSDEHTYTDNDPITQPTISSSLDSFPKFSVSIFTSSQTLSSQSLPLHL